MHCALFLSCRVDQTDHPAVTVTRMTSLPVYAENKSPTVVPASNRIAQRVHRTVENIVININFGVKFLMAANGNVNDSGWLRLHVADVTE